MWVSKKNYMINVVLKLHKIFELGFLKKKKFRFFFNLYKCFVSVCSSTPCVCLVPQEVTRRCLIPWNCCYKQLWEATWVLGTEPQSSARAASEWWISLFLHKELNFGWIFGFNNLKLYYLFICILLDIYYCCIYMCVFEFYDIHVEVCKRRPHFSFPTAQTWIITVKLY